MQNYKESEISLTPFRTNKNNGAFFQMLHYIYLTAIISISTSAPLGKSRTAKAERAG